MTERWRRFFLPKTSERYRQKKQPENPAASVVKSLSQSRGSRPIHNRCTSHKGNMRPTASASGQALRPQRWGCSTTAKKNVATVKSSSETVFNSLRCMGNDTANIRLFFYTVNIYWSFLRWVKNTLPCAEFELLPPKEGSQSSLGYIGVLKMYYTFSDEKPYLNFTVEVVIGVKKSGSKFEYSVEIKA